MVQLKIYNQDGNVTGEMAAPDFLVKPWNAPLAHQIFQALAANRRKPIAHTKNRSEVSGGGKKPWKQKGTGRARHGSTRSPLWRHGGITFGPRSDKDYSQKINKKMLAESLMSSLSKKLGLGELKIVANLEPENTKTKSIARTVSNLTGGKSALLVVSGSDKRTAAAAANLPNIKVLPVKDLNVYEILSRKYLIIDDKALKELSR